MGPAFSIGCLLLMYMKGRQKTSEMTEWLSINSFSPNVQRRLLAILVLICDTNGQLFFDEKMLMK